MRFAIAAAVMGVPAILAGAILWRWASPWVTIPIGIIAGGLVILLSPVSWWV